MAERPLKILPIREWPGLVTNRSPLVGEPGDALAMVNCHSPQPGVLQPRGGLQYVTYDNGADPYPAGVGDVISLSVQDKPGGNVIVFLTTDGDLVADENPVSA